MKKEETGLDILEQISVVTKDEHMRDIMRELEYCDELLYTENLPACKFIEVNARKQVLLEMRDSYSKWLNKQK